MEVLKSIGKAILSALLTEKFICDSRVIISCGRRSVIHSIALKKRFKRVGNKVKEIINDVINPKVIIHPKSIIGFIPLNTKDKKAHIVVKTV